MRRMIEKWIRIMSSQYSFLTTLNNTYICCLPGSHFSDPATPTPTATPDTPGSKFSVTAFHVRSA